MLQSIVRSTLAPWVTLAAGEASSVSRMVVPLSIFLVLAAILIGALSIVRRKVRSEIRPAGPRDFTLSDLRALHREGKLTAEEFERAKAKLVTRMQKALKKDAKPSLVEKPFAGELKEAFAENSPPRATLAEDDEDPDRHSIDDSVDESEEDENDENDDYKR